MANYEHIVQEHMKLHESFFNKEADIIKEVGELRDMAKELNQENFLLKKILHDVLPMVTSIEFQLSLTPKYSELIKSIIGEDN